MYTAEELKKQNKKTQRYCNKTKNLSKHWELTVSSLQLSYCVQINRDECTDQGTTALSES